MSLSVVIPCYNDGELLERSAGSVCPHLTQDDELIVVNDGSTDCTATQVAHLKERFPAQAVHYLFQTNQGVASARNHGLRLAKGEYVIFLDADDELTDGALASYRERIFEDSPTWMISGHEWGAENKTIERVPRAQGSSRLLFRGLLTKKLHIGNLSCMCIRRDIAERVGFDPHLRVCEDLVFLLVLIARFPPVIVPRINARVHRRAEGSLRSSTSLKQLIGLEMYDVLFAHPERPDEYRRYRKLALIRHSRSILRLAWKLKDASAYSRWYLKLVRADPLAILNLKLLWRYGEMRKSNQ